MVFTLKYTTTTEAPLWLKMARAMWVSASPKHLLPWVVNEKLYVKSDKNCFCQGGITREKRTQASAQMHSK